MIYLSYYRKNSLKPESLQECRVINCSDCCYDRQKVCIEGRHRVQTEVWK